MSFPTGTPATATPFAAPATNEATALDADLLRLLRCPLTKSVLRADGNFLVAEVGGLRYPIRDGIPVMLIEEATLPAGVGSLEALKQSLK